MTSDIKLLSINMQGAKPYNYTTSVVYVVKTNVHRNGYPSYIMRGTVTIV